MVHCIRTLIMGAIEKPSRSEKEGTEHKILAWLVHFAGGEGSPKSKTEEKFQKDRKKSAYLGQSFIHSGRR